MVVLPAVASSISHEANQQDGNAARAARHRETLARPSMSSGPFPHLLAQGELDEGWVAVPPGSPAPGRTHRHREAGQTRWSVPPLCQTFPAAYESIRGNRVT